LPVPRETVVFPPLEIQKGKRLISRDKFEGQGKRRKQYSRLRFQMSSALRLYADSKRMATAVLTKQGKFLQVYPETKTFSSEHEWRSHWSHLLHPEIVVEAEESKSWKPKEQASVTTENWTHQKTFTYTAPPGKYYIGDLCYVLGDALYSDVFGNYEYEPGLYTQGGTGNFFLVGSTAYGDGQYMGSDDRKFLVDAGIIGITPVSCMAKNDGGGHLYTFDNPVECTFKSGRFTFVSGFTVLEIDTAGSDDVEGW